VSNPAAAQSAASDIGLGEVVAVPVLSLHRGQSPRLEGEDQTHIARLAEIEGPLPPILVDRRSMRVIDGMHRLMAALLTGQETINVQYYDGSENDAFLRAVKANVTHGLPLSLADRRAAAERIIRSHPHMSDRSISHLTGLASKTIATVRRSAGARPQLHARVGRDGRVRPLNGALGREHAAALIARHPDASLREVARDAGISPGTVRDVRRRLESGEKPAAGHSRDPDADGNEAGASAAGQDRPCSPRARSARAPARVPGRAVDLEALLDRLRRDPSLRYNEQGRRLLRVLQLNTVMAEEWASLTSTVPPHSVTTVAQFARQYARMWLRFAQELLERPETTGVDGSQDAEG
jgi:ParB-like chromosome segregation protein Spo0J